MRKSEGLPPDPEVLEELEAIDAALLGLRVDPRHAELAELTLLLADERPRITPEFAQGLDARVARRFAPESHPAPDGGARPPRRRRRSALRMGSLFGAGFAAAAAVAVGVIVIADNNGSPAIYTTLNAAGTSTAATAPHAKSFARTVASPPAAAGVTATAGTSSGFGGVSSAGGGSSGTPANSGQPARSTPSHASASAPSPPDVFAPTTSAVASPAPVDNGRKTVQSAQLQLTAPDSRLDDVSQEVFDVVGEENGIVKSSSVTAGDGGYATFSLSIPSQNLQETMTRLSELRYAVVSSRTDATQDVNSEYLNDQRALADARALRTSLLKQLAKAYTETQIDSLTAQIHDAEASISSDEATLNGLNGRISYSALSLQINAGPIVVPVAHHATPSKGFTIGKAAHDAVKVLTVAAGVALIVLAALIPFGLVVALAAWIAYWVRRRRREHALDVA